MAAYAGYSPFTPPPFVDNAITIPLRLNTMDNERIAVVSAMYWLFTAIDAYEERQRLYDTLASIDPNVYQGQYCDQYSERLERILQCIQRELRHIESLGARRALLKEALGCAESLARVNEPYGDVGRTSAHIRLDCLNILSSIRHDYPRPHNNRYKKSEELFFNAVSIRLIYLDYNIRGDCADTITSGDVRGLSGAKRTAMTSEQEKCYEAMRSSLDALTDEQLQEQFDPNEQHLISTIEDSLLSQHGGFQRYDKLFLKGPQPLEPDEANGPATRDTLSSIAYCILESNQLFDQFVNQDTPTGYLVSLRTSYERLSQYCSLSGESELHVDLVDRISQINQMIEVNETGESGANENGAPVTEIKSLLGLSKPTGHSFDAFISYSHNDGDVATKVYRFLKESLREPFFDRMSLPEMSDSDYENAIMEALDHSKHLVLILSDLSALQSRWVNLEVSVFLHEVTEGRKSGGNVLLIVSDKVWTEIAESNKTCLPIRLRSSEIFKFGSYRSSLLSYL